MSGYHIKIRYDALTGCLNRHVIVSTVKEQIAFCRRKHIQTSVLILDLDHFKAINDEFGHLSGDVVLKRVAACITSVVRDNDKVGRYGGEEFVVILPASNVAKGAQVAERIRESVAALQWREVAGDLDVSVSCGVTEVLPTDTVESVVARADAALYEAKHKGRNRVECVPVCSAAACRGRDGRSEATRPVGADLAS